MIVLNAVSFHQRTSLRIIMLIYNSYIIWILLLRAKYSVTTYYRKKFMQIPIGLRGIF